MLQNNEICILIIKNVFLYSLQKRKTMVEVENIGHYLKAKSIRPSLQRIRILEYLIKNRNHPTVEMIYNELLSEMPTLSKTTIYNTLKLFVENNVAIIINIEDNETRYDADTSIHGHFKCTECEGVFDFNVDVKMLQFMGLEGFNISEHHIYLKGVCRVCKSKELA